jgi:hypothetical protein
MSILRADNAGEIIVVSGFTGSSGLMQTAAVLPRLARRISDAACNPVIHTDRLNATHMTTNRSKNVFGCMNPYTLIKNALVL